MVYGMQQITGITTTGNLRAWHATSPEVPVQAEGGA
jgi:hypothetical protein